MMATPQTKRGAPTVAEYRVVRARCPARVDAAWDGDEWKHVPSVRLDYFRPESSDHRPRVEVRLQHTGGSLWGLFRVEDRYVRAVHTRYQSSVCQDSCVEFFVRPKPAAGYFNFEFNCGGALLCSYIEDWTRFNGTFRRVQSVPEDLGRQVGIYHSLPRRVEPEMTDPVVWFLGFEIPRCIFEAYTGDLGDWSGQVWTANFYKCADRTSHPHWASWSPVPELNFHLPDSFGSLILE